MLIYIYPIGAAAPKPPSCKNVSGDNYEDVYYVNCDDGDDVDDDDDEDGDDDAHNMI